MSKKQLDPSGAVPEESAVGGNNNDLELGDHNDDLNPPRSDAGTGAVDDTATTATRTLLSGRHHSGENPPAVAMAPRPHRISGSHSKPPPSQAAALPPAELIAAGGGGGQELPTFKDQTRSVTNRSQPYCVTPAAARREVVPSVEGVPVEMSSVNSNSGAGPTALQAAAVLETIGERRRPPRDIDAKNTVGAHPLDQAVAAVAANASVPTTATGSSSNDNTTARVGVGIVEEEEVPRPSDSRNSHSGSNESNSNANVIKHLVWAGALVVIAVAVVVAVVLVLLNDGGGGSSSSGSVRATDGTTAASAGTAAPVSPTTTSAPVAPPDSKPDPSVALPTPLPTTIATPDVQPPDAPTMAPTLIPAPPRTETPRTPGPITAAPSSPPTTTPKISAPPTTLKPTSLPTEAPRTREPATTAPVTTAPVTTPPTMKPTSPPTDAPITPDPTTAAPMTAPPTLKPTFPPTGAPTPGPTTDPTSPPTALPTRWETPPPIAFVDEIRGRDDDDSFGTFVILSRDGAALAVGATGGSYVRAFRRDGNQWNQIGSTIDASGGSFGACIALSQDGTVMAVGAWNNDDAAENAGNVKIFYYNGSEWNQVGQTLTGSAAGDRFGWEVALAEDGNTLAVSARLGDPASDRDDAGYVRVYTYSGDPRQSTSENWVQLGPDLEGEAPGDQFGRSLAIDAAGGRVAVGGQHGGGGKGRIRVFDYLGGQWNYVGQPLDGDSDEDWQGTSVALSAGGSILAIGADGTDTNGSNSGMVRVYELQGSSWSQRGQNLLGEEPNDQFGASHIALSSDGSCLAVGSNHDNDRGKGYLYWWSGSQWVEAAAIEGINEGDHMGESVTVSGDCKWLAFGAPERDASGTPPGYVRIYQVF